MEKPFYEFNLVSEYGLTSELENLHSFCLDTSNYDKLIFRGPEKEGFGNTFKQYDSFIDLDKEYNELENWIDDETMNIGQLSLFGNSIDWKDYPMIYNFIISKIFQIYEDDLVIRKLSDTSISVKKFNLSEGLLTMYKKGGRLSPHRDGKPTIKTDFTKLANILLYLNKDYQKEWGGCFVVDDTEIIPEYGKLVLLNFKGDSDPEHSVSMLREDVNRIALLFNITYLSNEKIIWNTR